MRLLGSIAIHALLAVLLISIHRSREEAGAPPAVELVDVAIVDVAIAPRVAPAVAAPPQRAQPAARRRDPIPDRDAAPPRAPDAARTDVAPDLRARGPDGADAALDGDATGAGDGADGAGHGTGGLGFGNGRGLGDLAQLTPSIPAPPPAPPAPKVSRARRARLVYPSRQTQVDADRLFVAELVVDRDGFVVGAHLARGSGSPRDGEAGAAVWRFRYAPALDDDGAPVRSTVRQTFAVAW